MQGIIQEIRDRSGSRRNFPLPPDMPDVAIGGDLAWRCSPDSAPELGSKWPETGAKSAESRPQMGQNGSEMGPNWRGFEGVWFVRRRPIGGKWPILDRKAVKGGLN